MIALQIDVAVCAPVTNERVSAGATGNTTKGGKAMCEEVWGNAFVYAEGNTQGYVMNFTGPNPNDDLYPDVGLPEPCPDHNITTAQLQAACPAEVRSLFEIQTRAGVTLAKQTRTFPWVLHGSLWSEAADNT